MTKVFICWAGDRAKHVAKALYRWLPDVLQNVDPWMSRESIAAGVRWSPEIDQELDLTNFGIVCVTPENVGEPWLNYEAGALAKKVEIGRVVPYLIDMNSVAEIQGPLTRFQAKIALTESLDVLKSLNEAMDDQGIPLDRLERSFEQWWPSLQAELNSVPALVGTVQAPSVNDMVGEILENVRELSRISAATTVIFGGQSSGYRNRPFTSHLNEQAALILTAPSMKAFMEKNGLASSYFRMNSRTGSWEMEFVSGTGRFYPVIVPGGGSIDEIVKRILYEFSAGYGGIPKIEP